RSAAGEPRDEVEGIPYAVWRRTGGRAPDEFRDEEVAVLGRLLARIHNVGAASPAPDRPRLDSETGLRAPLRLLEERGFLPRECARRYRDAALRVADLYHAWSAALPGHRIHGRGH